MLDPWVIEEIKRREEERDRGGEQRIEISIPMLPESDETTKPGEDPGPRRGVVVIDL